MKLLTNIFLSLGFVILSLISFATNPPDTIRFNPTITNYDQIPDSFDFEIVQYQPATVHCGIFATASVCIGHIVGDSRTIRVLSLCNLSTVFSAGMIVKVHAVSEPSFSVSIFNPSQIIYDQTIFGGLSIKSPLE
jgi:hypothetical protein